MILEMFEREKGLKLGDTAPDRIIECPECNSDFEFNTNDESWDDDGKFEFIDVECEDCNHRFQICALSDGTEYEFFTA